MLGLTVTLLLGMASSARALLLDFTSTGVLACGTAANCSGGGGSIAFTNGPAIMTLSYTANVESDLNVPLAPAAAGTMLGFVAVNCTVCAGLTANFDVTGATLTLGVNQGPDPFNVAKELFTGALEGTLTVTTGASFGGLGIVRFDPRTDQTLNGNTIVLYALQQPVDPPGAPGGYLVSLGNVTTFQAAVSDFTGVTTTTSTTTTTTTLPGNPCAGVPSSASLVSLGCRAGALAALTETSLPAGRLRDQLFSSVARAQSGIGLARVLCAASQSGPAGVELKAAAKQLSGYGKRLNGKVAKQALSEALRTALGEAASDLVADLQARREALVCPNDA